MAHTQSSLINNTIGSEDASRQQNEVKEVLRVFLNRIMATSDGFRAAEAHVSGGKLYEDVSRKVADFIQAAGDDPNFIQKLSVTGCNIAELAYGHTSPEHQYYIALYTACFLYVDDLGTRHLEAVSQFSRRFANGEKQLNPALDVFTDLLRQSYDLWPQVGADSIVSGTLEGVTAMYIEYTTSDMTVTPRATWWPNYFRTRNGFCSPYTHFSFMKSWRPTPVSYVQLLPYLDFFIAGANDILSFYKEQLAGETDNYIHIRATTDQTTTLDTLRLLADETLACVQRIRLLIGEDRELMAIWRSLQQGYVAFHMKTPRYRLAELM
ncbi:terpenoid synthase [Ganoderma leucocontextum]|nr:terpenoid synthase [Ganoderma leucocontextum]